MSDSSSIPQLSPTRSTKDELHESMQVEQTIDALKQLQLLLPQLAASEKAKLKSALPFATAEWIDSLAKSIRQKDSGVTEGDCKTSAAAPVSTLRQRNGATLWKKASDKVHTYHAVTHQVQHRATEKVGFGIAEHVLELIGQATLDKHATAHVLEHVGEASATVMGDWPLQRTAKSFGTLIGDWPFDSASAQQSASGALMGDWPAATSAASHSSAAVIGDWPAAKDAKHAVQTLAEGLAGTHGAAAPATQMSHAMRAWSGALEAIKLAIPMAGVYLIAHMAHHDLHRVHHEHQKRGYCLTTLLFFIAFVCDALDAIAHAIIVVCMLAEYMVDGHTLHLYHIDHHLVHEVHHAAMNLAICATVTMVLGEILSVHASANANASASASANASAKALQQAVAKGDKAVTKRDKVGKATEQKGAKAD
mmetsp:Transcript_1299/g.2761  ORF Transcript_1299/g.2761 Transcript_1299/m.2761 type:complete len:422 (-) Transcript_1299:393-1658(-)